MRKKICLVLSSLALVAVLAPGSLTPRAVAADSAESRGLAGASALQAPEWLRNFLSLLGLMSADTAPRLMEEISSAVADSSEPKSPAGPGSGISPQAGPNIDPDG